MATAISMITRSMRLARVLRKGEAPDDDELVSRFQQVQGR